MSIKAHIPDIGGATLIFHVHEGKPVCISNIEVFVGLEKPLSDM
jgi:hypothetical protein